MCPSGSKFLPSDCCFIDLALKNQTHTDGLVQSGHHQKISKKDIEEALKSEMSGDLLRGMLTIGEFWKFMLKFCFLLVRI
jgi:hypothetical protein